MRPGVARRQDADVKPEEIDDLVAGNVRAARARLKLRQIDLADDMGWTPSIISALEAGTRRITIADAVALCGALDMDLRQLLAGAPAEVMQKLGIERRADG